MITLAIPGCEELRLCYLVLDYNGTLACDGALIPGVTERLHRLAEDLTIQILTADTFGKAASVFAELPCTLTTLGPGDHVQAKLDLVRQLGTERTVCIGNGRNDRLMLQHAALGIGVVLEEGAAVETICAADVICTSITAALDLLVHPLRLKATLRR